MGIHDSPSATAQSSHLAERSPGPGARVSSKTKFPESAIRAEKTALKGSGGFGTFRFAEMPITSGCQHAWNPQLGDVKRLGRPGAPCRQRPGASCRQQPVLPASPGGADLLSTLESRAHSAINLHQRPSAGQACPCPPTLMAIVLQLGRRCCVSEGFCPVIVLGNPMPRGRRPQRLQRLPTFLEDMEEPGLR